MTNYEQIKQALRRQGLTDGQIAGVIAKLPQDVREQAERFEAMGRTSAESAFCFRCEGTGFEPNTPLADPKWEPCRECGGGDRGKR